MKKNSNSFEVFRKQAKKFAREKPWHFAGIVIAAIIILFWVLSALEILPERAERRMQQGMVIEQGDSMSWIGMRVIQMTRSIRREFNIPRTIKGMFVIDEGQGAARKYGVKTGDVIISVGKKPVPSARAFVNIANRIQYYDGIILDIYRDGKRSYVTIPFEYQYGPLMGPRKGSWQLGAPLAGQGIQYGPVIK